MMRTAVSYRRKLRAPPDKIDMRQIVLAIAQILSITLPEGELQPLNFH